MNVQLRCSVFSSKDNTEYCRINGKTFYDATVGYLEDYFPNLSQAHRVPPVLIMCDEFKRRTKIDNESGKKITEKIGRLAYVSNQCLERCEGLTSKDIREITSDRKGVWAVESLVKMLILCEHELPGGMFVISNLQYRKYLTNLKDTHQLVTAQNGDHDIIVIHRKLGVIFFQVKACSSESDKKTKLQAVSKALEQVMKDKFVFMESNRDLEFVHQSLPVYGFAALPHLQSVDLDELNICSTHHKNILTLNDMQNLSGWLKERISPCSNDKIEVMDEVQYKIICGRYVGLASKITLRTYDEGIREIGKMVQFAFLTPVQLAIIRQKDKYFVVSGDYGTGKSLVLAKKAEMLVEEDERCVAFIISCSDIDNYHLCKFDKPYKSADQLKRFVKEESLKSGKIKILQFNKILKAMQIPDEKGKRMVSSEEFYTTIVSYISDFAKQNPNIKTHLFLDEVLLSLFKVGALYGKPERCKFWDDLESVLPQGSYCGISISTYSYPMSDQLDPKDITCFVPMNFKLHYLEFIMRVPGGVCDVAKCIEGYTGNGFLKHSSIGHAIMGPMPLLSTLTCCKCPSPGSTVCLCGQTRLLETLNKVMEKFDIKSHVVTIVMFFFHCEEYLLPLYRRFQAVVQNAFFELDIELEWNTMYGLQIPWVSRNPNSVQKIISVVDQHTFIGCESQNVMFIDVFGMFQWFKHMSEWFTFLVNRCASQYIHINWPKAEAREQWLFFLHGYEKYCKASQNDFMMSGITKMLDKARGSQGQCVEILKERHLIHEI